MRNLILICVPLLFAAASPLVYGEGDRDRISDDAFKAEALQRLRESDPAIKAKLRDALAEDKPLAESKGMKSLMDDLAEFLKIGSTPETAK